MKKSVMVIISSSVVIFSLLFAVGCQPPPAEEPEPLPSPPPETEQPMTPDGDSEPSPADEAQPEEEVEPVMHSSAYIKFDGVDGESENEGHEGWSQIVSFEQWIHKPESGATGTARRRGDVILEDITLVKQVDKATPKLAEATCIGRVFPTVEIHLTGPSEGSTCSGTFYICELKNVMITSYRVSGSNPLAYELVIPAPETIVPSAGPFIAQAVDAPVEEMSLNFEEIKVTYTECDSSGKSKGNVEYSWKVEEGES